MEVDLRRQLGPSLGELVVDLGMSITRAEEITVVPAFGVRRTYRLWCSDGRTLKGRNFPSAARAEVAWRIHEQFGSPVLAKAIARRGEAMLEEWVEGSVLAGGPIAPALICQAGRLLGALHACPVPGIGDIAHEPLDVEGWLRKTEDNLSALEDQGVLSAAGVARLLDLAHARRREAATIGVVHRDLCPENLVLRSDGQLVSVDNGSLTIGSIAEDLARLRYRWPMSAGELDAFCAGYEEFRSADGLRGVPWFWHVIVLVNSARARLGISRSAASAVVRPIASLLQEADGAPQTISVRTQTRHRRAFAFRGLRMNVTCSIAQPLSWLQAFLSPHLDASQGSGSAFEIDLLVDQSECERVRGCPRMPRGTAIDCFVADGRFEQLTLWQEDAAGRVLHDNRADAFLRIPTKGGPIRVLVGRDCGRLRVLLMRIVRELALLQALQHGDLFLHAAAVVSGVGGVLIAGPKEAGKTTMLLDFLRSGGARFLANDRVMVDLTGASAIARGVPTIIKVRPGSLDYLSGLAEPAFGFPHRHYLTLRECAAGSPLIEPPTRQPPSLSPPQFCKWLNVTGVADAVVELIVFPVLDPSVRRSGLRRLSSKQAAQRLVANQFSGGGSGVVSPALAGCLPGNLPPADSVEQACSTLAHHAAAIECRLGPEAFVAPGVWDALLKRGAIAAT